MSGAALFLPDLGYGVDGELARVCMLGSLVPERCSYDVHAGLHASYSLQTVACRADPISRYQRQPGAGTFFRTKHDKVPHTFCLGTLGTPRHLNALAWYVSKV